MAGTMDPAVEVEEETPPGRAAPRRGRSPWVPVLAILWLAACAFALARVADRDLQPGARAGSPPSAWPGESAIPGPEGRPTLLLFLHPRCPCSNATLAELERLLVRCGDRVLVRAMFVAPAGTPPEWNRGALRDRASRIPGVLVEDDRGGAEARRFRATTSGTAILYGADGDLGFHGGITLARAHEGDNPGRASVAALVNGGRPAATETPVFGCPLEAPLKGPFPVGTSAESPENLR